MKDMKDSGISWMGSIPSDWKVEKVKHGFVRKKSEAHQNNPTVLSLARSGVKERDISTNEGQIAESYYNYNPVDIDDLLINPMDLYSGANCSISKIQGVISPAYVNLRFKNGYNPEYYDYYFKIQYWMLAFFAHGKGVSFDNRWTLNAETLMNYPIIVPSYKEQCAIVDFLVAKCAQIDSIITKHEECIEKLKEYKLSIITEAVTNGLDPKSEMKESGIEWIGKIPSNWKVVKMKTMIDCLPGYAFESDNYQTDNGIRLLRGVNVTPSGIRWNDVVFWSEKSLDSLDHYFLRENDIVVGLDRPWISEGMRACIVEKKDLPCLLLQRVCRIRVTGAHDFRWIYHWLKSASFENVLSIETTGVSVPHISTKQIDNFVIAVPPQEEERQICDHIEKKTALIDSRIHAHTQAIDSLNEYKKSIIYEVVTGKKEV